MKQALARLQQPLHTYIACFDEHIAFLNVNVQELVQSLQPSVKDNISTLRRPALTLCVDHHIQARLHVLSSIPCTAIELGVVVVDATVIRTQLEEKHTTIIQQLLTLLASHIQTNGRRLLSSFEAMTKQLQSFPRNIEELAKLKEYCGTVPGLIEEMKEPILALYSDFDVLEQYSYQAPKLFSQRWEICQWPRRISKIVKRSTETIEQKKQQYSLQMCDEQVIFEQNLAALEAEVRGFGSYTDIRNSKEVEVQRLALSSKLEIAKNQVFHSSFKMFFSQF